MLRIIFLWGAFGFLSIYASPHKSNFLQLEPMVSLPPVMDELSAKDKKMLSRLRKVRLGISSTSHEPLELIQGEVFKGITADYFSIIGASLGLSLEVRAYKTQDLALAALRSGEIDTLAATRGGVDSSEFIFSKSYVENRPVLVSRVNSLRVNSFPRPAGTTALLDGYLSERNIHKNFQHATPVRVSTVRKGLQAVNMEKVDGFVGDEITTAYQIAQGGFNKLNISLLHENMQSGFSFIFNRNDTGMKALFDLALNKIPEAIKASILSYWGVRPPFDQVLAAKYTDAEKFWLAGRPNVVVGLNRSIPPLSFSGEDAELHGLIPSILSEISYYSGVNFEFVSVSTFKDLEAGFEQGDIDMTLMPSSLAQKDTKDLFTSPLLQGSFVLVSAVNKEALGLNELSGKRIALTELWTGIETLQNMPPGVIQVPVEEPLDSLVALLENRADYALILRPVAEYLVRQYFPGELRVIDISPELDSAIPLSIRSNNLLLLGVLDKTLNQIGPGRIANLTARWYGLQPAEKGEWTNYFRLGRWLIFVGGVVLFISLVWCIYISVQRNRMRAEMRLQAYRSNLIDGIPLSIAVRDLHGAFVLCNKEFYKLFKLKPAHVIGLRAEEFPDVAPILSESLSFKFDELFAKETAELRQVETCVDEKRLILQQWSVPFYGYDGRVAGVIMGWMDMTSNILLLQQLKVARDQAVDASEAKSRFLAVMSHEIRTPLNAIIGLLELTLCKVDHGEPWDREAVEVAHASSGTLSLLLGDILDLAAIESGRLSLEPKHCVPHAILDSVVRVFEGIARQKGLYLQVDINPQARRPAIIDGIRLKQVLSNILSNAIKFTDHGSIYIALDVQSDGDELNLKFIFKDSGIGISSRDQELLFEPFSQVRNEHNQRGGSGLGLAICRQIIETMNGSINLDSAPGQGTTVTIKLAVPKSSKTKHSVVKPTNSPAPLTSSLRVLLADDHPANRLLLSQQLRFLGHSVYEAKDGAEAISIFKASIDSFDLVITDLSMPIVNGYDLSRNIRSIERASCLKPIFIVGFTASALISERLRCLEAGMDDCLFKPIGLSALRKCLWAIAHKTAIPTNHLPATGVGRDIQDFDLGCVNTLTGGDQKLTNMLLRELYRCNELDFYSLNEGLSLGLWRDQAKLVHRLKGAAEIVGAHQLIDASLAYEKGLDGKLSDDNIKSLAIGVLNALAELQLSLEKLFKSQHISCDLKPAKI